MNAGKDGVQVQTGVENYLSVVENVGCGDRVAIDNLPGKEGPLPRINAGEIARDIQIADRAAGNNFPNAAQLVAEGMGGDAGDIVGKEDIAIEAVGGVVIGVTQLSSGSQIANDETDVAGDVEGGIGADGYAIDIPIIVIDHGDAAENLHNGHRVAANGCLARVRVRAAEQVGACYKESRRDALLERLDQVAWMGECSRQVHANGKIENAFRARTVPPGDGAKHAPLRKPFDFLHCSLHVSDTMNASERRTSHPGERWPESALIILGHGSTVNPDSSTPTAMHAEAITRKGVFAEVVCGYWKEEPSFRQVLDMVESREVYIVPNFISEGYFTQKIIPRELGLEGAVTEVKGQLLKYCEPVGNHPAMTDLLLHRAREIAPEVNAAQAALVIVGHGTSLNENSGVAVKEQVERIRGRGLYREVLGMFMEEEPLVTNWQEATAAEDVIVVPFFVSDGLHSYQDIPVLLGIEAETGPAASAAEVFRRNPYHVGGRRLYYSSAIGTDPLFATVILDQVRSFDAHHPQLCSAA